MFSLNNIPSTTTVFSAYTSIAASAMLIRTIVNEVKSMATQLIPNKLQQKILSILEGFYGNMSSQLTLVIDEYDGYVSNEMFEASEIYLRTKITPSIDRLKVRKIQRENNLLVSVENGQDITDIFEGVELNWKLSCTTDPSSSEKKYFELSFPKKFNKLVFDSYLPHVMKISKAIQGKNKMPKLYSLDFCGDEDGGGLWGSIKFDHPSTFDTLAMDSKLKNELLEDLDRFVKRREFYKRVGKAWKRGYLLYGPPGTGKSSLIAAMANHLSFNIYDLELANIHSNSQLRQVLVATANRSILIIEDIDCTVESHDRSHAGGDYSGHSQRTLSGLLNFIDGLWSSVGDERIIVFTTNHKDKLDPALLRPGRMDMHIHMSYITPHGFRILVNNYLQINEHFLFEEIDVLIQEVNVTAAEVAEELMKSEDAEIALRSVIDFIKTKKTKLEEKNNNVEKEDDHGSKQEKGKNKRKNNNRKKG